MIKPIRYFNHYSIYDNGIIINKITKKKLKIFYRNGYPCVSLYSKDKHQYIKYLHRLLATAFIHNKYNYPIVNHIDGNKLNYDLKNLEWCSYSHNNKHAYQTGLNKPKKGTSSHVAKLTKKEVKEIRFLLKVPTSATVIARKYSVSRGAINAIRYNKTHKGD